MRTGQLRPQSKVLDHWQLLHESDFENTDTKLLLHLDNEVTDWATGKTITNTNVTFSSTVWKFNTHSALFNGTTAYLTVPDSVDWYFGTGDFTIDLWYMPNASNYTATFFQQYADANNYWKMIIFSNQLYFYCVGGGTSQGSYYTTNAQTWTTGTWYHIAVVRNGSNCYMFKDGVSLPVSQTTAWGTLPDVAATLYIGQNSVGGDYVNGWIDELRIVKGTAKWTSDFTPPTAPYLGRTTTYPITKDRNNVLMISGEGANNSTAVIDECGKAVTCNGDAKIDTSQFKFGASSVKFDGTGDYLTIPHSADWDFGSQDFTIDFWVRFNAFQGSGYNMLVCQWYTAKYAWTSLYYTGSLYFSYTTDGTTSVATAFSWTPSLSTWYHIAFVRNGNDLKAYVDGTQVGSTKDVTGVTIYNSDQALWIGQDQDNTAGYYLNGWLDDIRISKGIARWTSAFTPPIKTTALINGDTDEEYKLILDIHGAVDGCAFRLNPNNDTGANYGYQQLAGINAAVSATRSTDAFLRLYNAGLNNGYESIIDTILYAKSGYIRTAISTISDAILGTTVTNTAVFGHVWNNSTAPIASLILSSDLTGGIGVGSKFILYRKVQ